MGGIDKIFIWIMAIFIIGIAVFLGPVGIIALTILIITSLLVFIAVRVDKIYKILKGSTKSQKS